jgi:6-phosphogluconolactonase
MSAQQDIRICEDAAALAQQTTDIFVRLAQESVAARGRFTVALAGGSTPKAAYAMLASAAYRDRVPWQQTHFFWGDERHVPPDHEDSNYHMAYEAMLSKVTVPAAHIYRIAAEKEAQQAADDYEATLRTAFQLAGDSLPRFDLVLLGMGPDGHTASLFPGTAAVHESKRLVAAPWVEKFKTFRITLTPPVLCNAAYVVFAAGGADKTETLQRCYRVHTSPTSTPPRLSSRRRARCCGS